MTKAAVDVLFIGAADYHWIPMVESSTRLPNALWMPEWSKEGEPAVPVLYKMQVTYFGGRQLPVYISSEVAGQAVNTRIIRALFNDQAFQAWVSAEVVAEAGELG